MLEFAVERAVAPNTPLVVFETLDDETIIMHHGTGYYFNTVGSGTVIWQALESGASLAAVADSLAGAFMIEPREAEAVARDFVDVLAQHGLIRDIPDAPPLQPIGSPVRRPFELPVLGVHTDLADMLLLDPIHEVDDAGWPAARQHESVG